MQNRDAPTFDDVRSTLEHGGKHVTLLYIQAQQKGPIYKGWNTVSYQDTLVPQYQADLESHPNTGVLLGPPSEGLSMIDCDTEPLLEAVLQDNPWLGDTLRTRGSRGGAFWLFLGGKNCPQGVCTLKVHKDSPLAVGAENDPDEHDMIAIGELRCANNGVIRGIHPKGCVYKWLVSNPPISADYDQILWPPDIQITWEQKRTYKFHGTETESGGTASDDLLRRAIECLSVTFLWDHFGYGPRRNPSPSPFREDNTRGHNSFSIYDEGRRFKDHNAAYLHHRGDSFDFYQLAMRQDAHQAFAGFIELAGLGDRLRRNTANSTNSTGGQNIDTVSEEPSCPYREVDWLAIDKTIVRTCQRFSQETIYPTKSILAPYMAFARTACESADTHLIGAILPVVGALLARRVYISWPHRNIYPNLFSLLVGPAGQRKSDAVKCASRVAWTCLPMAAFLKKHLSTEALFEEYCEENGGLADKLLLSEEANIIMAAWTKTDYGARVAAEFLDLYDCGPLSESFMRNKSKKTGPGRIISETSTSVAIAGTFNVATFPIEQIKQGIQRRFMFNVSETMGRTIHWPDKKVSLAEAVEGFKPLLAFGGEIDMPKDGLVWDFWVNYQDQNRKALNEVGMDNDALSARLATTPTSVLKVSMLYEACIAAHAGLENMPQWFSLDSLEPAKEYVEAHMKAAGFIDRHGARKVAEEQAEVVLATIRKEFKVGHPGTIYVTRSELTRRFCHNTGRQGAMTLDDLYLRILPVLERQGEAVQALKKGKFEVYAFRTELTP